MSKVLAINVNGDITYCTVPPEMRGKGRCNHIAHQNEGESVEDFIERINTTDPNDKVEVEEAKEISQSEIDDMASQLDAIAGERVTADNLNEVLSRMSPDQMAAIAKLGFDAAPKFSLPIRDEDYEDENVKNKLYFATLPKFHIGGNEASLTQMFERVGSVATLDDDVVIEHSYEEGLTPHEYFAKQFTARDAMIHKTVSVAMPGYTARKLFYAFSDIQVFKDCGGPHIDALHCKLPEGHVCEKCAHATQGGEHVHEGELIGGLISTNVSEPLTQLSMKQMHSIIYNQKIKVKRNKYM